MGLDSRSKTWAKLFKKFKNTPNFKENKTKKCAFIFRQKAKGGDFKVRSYGKDLGKRRSSNQNYSTFRPLISILILQRV